jgi:FtsH-binding integral membrane protein
MLIQIFYGSSRGLMGCVVYNLDGAWFYADRFCGLEAGVVLKGAILGALSLYLDFINLFLMLLRIMGDRR